MLEEFTEIIMQKSKKSGLPSSPTKKEEKIRGPSTFSIWDKFFKMIKRLKIRKYINTTRHLLIQKLCKFLKKR